MRATRIFKDNTCCINHTFWCSSCCSKYIRCTTRWQSAPSCGSSNRGNSQTTRRGFLYWYNHTPVEKETADYSNCTMEPGRVFDCDGFRLLYDGIAEKHIILQIFLTFLKQGKTLLTGPSILILQLHVILRNLICLSVPTKWKDSTTSIC